MRISDWSSDVCSSDLPKAIAILRYGVIEAPFHQPQRSLPACHRSDRDAVPSGVHMQSHHRSNAWNKDYLKVWWIEASRSQTTRFENALQILPLISGYGTRHHRHRLNVARSMGAKYVPHPLQTFADLEGASPCGAAGSEPND